MLRQKSSQVPLGTKHVAPTTCLAEAVIRETQGKHENADSNSDAPTTFHNSCGTMVFTNFTSSFNIGLHYMADAPKESSHYLLLMLACLLLGHLYLSKLGRLMMRYAFLER